MAGSGRVSLAHYTQPGDEFRVNALVAAVRGRAPRRGARRRARRSGRRCILSPPDPPRGVDHRLRTAVSRYIGGSNSRPSRPRADRNRFPRHHRTVGGIQRRLPWLLASAQSRNSTRSLPPLLRPPASWSSSRCWRQPRPCGDAGRAPKRRTPPRTPRPPDAERFFQSIVKVRARAVPDARSSATLGREREGTGVVIGDDGLILTIGYLIVEADEVSLVDQTAGRTLAGAGGRLRPRDADWGWCARSCRWTRHRCRFGESGKLADRDPVMIVNHARRRRRRRSPTSSRRGAFTGNWEYLLDQAIFTSPPTLNWSGAALVDKDLKAASASAR